MRSNDVSWICFFLVNKISDKTCQSVVFSLLKPELIFFTYVFFLMVKCYEVSVCEILSFGMKRFFFVCEGVFPGSDSRNT